MIENKFDLFILIEDSSTEKLRYIEGRVDGAKLPFQSKEGEGWLSLIGKGMRLDECMSYLDMITQFDIIMSHDSNISYAICCEKVVFTDMQRDGKLDIKAFLEAEKYKDVPAVELFYYEMGDFFALFKTINRFTYGTNKCCLQ